MGDFSIINIGLLIVLLYYTAFYYIIHKLNGEMCVLYIGVKLSIVYCILCKCVYCVKCVYCCFCILYIFHILLFVMPWHRVLYLRISPSVYLCT